jgi:hypothetical protein
MNVRVIASRSVTIAKAKSLGSVKLLSQPDIQISQLCEMGYNCLFTDKGVAIFRRSDGSFAFNGVLRGKLYLMDSIPEEVELDRCLISKTNMG